MAESRTTGNSRARIGRVRSMPSVVLQRFLGRTPAETHVRSNSDYTTWRGNTSLYEASNESGGVSSEIIGQGESFTCGTEVDLQDTTNRSSSLSSGSTTVRSGSEGGRSTRGTSLADEGQIETSEQADNTDEEEVQGNEGNEEEVEAPGHEVSREVGNHTEFQGSSEYGDEDETENEHDEDDEAEAEVEHEEELQEFEEITGNEEEDEDEEDEADDEGEVEEHEVGNHTESQGINGNEEDDDEDDGHDEGEEMDREVGNHTEFEEITGNEDEDEDEEDEGEGTEYEGQEVGREVGNHTEFQGSSEYGGETADEADDEYEEYAEYEDENHDTEAPDALALRTSREGDTEAAQKLFSSLVSSEPTVKRRVNLACVEWQLQNYERAEELCAEAIDSTTNGVLERENCLLFEIVANAETSLGMPIEEIRYLFEIYHECCTERFGIFHPETTGVIYEYIDILRRSGYLKDAELHLREYVQLVRAEVGDYRWEYAIALFHHARAHWQLGNVSQALTVQRQAVIAANNCNNIWPWLLEAITEQEEKFIALSSSSSSSSSFS